MWTFLQGPSEGGKDWLVAGAVGGTAVGVTIADLNMYLSLVSLLIAVLIGLPRLIMNWGTLLRWLRGNHDNLPRD